MSPVARSAAEAAVGHLREDAARESSRWDEPGPETTATGFTLTYQDGSVLEVTARPAPDPSDAVVCTVRDCPGYGTPHPVLAWRHEVST